MKLKEMQREKSLFINYCLLPITHIIAPIAAVTPQREGFREEARSISV
jgi:hypothetical protein